MSTLCNYRVSSQKTSLCHIFDNHYNIFDNHYNISLAQYVNNDIISCKNIMNKGEPL